MKLDDCGCCGADAGTTGVQNDPGLDQIVVRVGDFGSFKRAMHEALGREDALRQLTSRDDADPALAVLDAWAAALDVLTFYNDRIANESYLRTATEARSVREFAREIGYLPAPATAALADLSFTVANVASVRIDAGTKVQSQPGQDELPQTFETLETIVGRPELNVMRVRWQEIDPLQGTDHAEFVGASVDLKVGDVLLFVAHDSANGYGLDAQFDLARIVEVVRNVDRATTSVRWDPATGYLGSDPPQVCVLRQKAAVFGYNALDKNLLSDAAKTALASATSWAEDKLSGQSLDLDALYPAFGPGSWVVVRTSQTGQDAPYPMLFKVGSNLDGVATKYGMSGKSSRLAFAYEGLSQFTARDAVVLGGSEVLAVAPRTIVGRETDDQPPKYIPPYLQNAVELADAGIALEAGRALLVVGKRPRCRFPNGTWFKRSDGASIQIPGFAETFRLDGPPQPLPIPNYHHRFSVIRDDGTRGTVDAYLVQVAFLPVPADDPADLSERTVVDDQGVAKLKNVYDRTTTVVYGNVARASHGETKREVLGSGNAAASFQQFTLSHAPLTYLAAPTESGVASTLEIRVEDVLWHETPTLLDDGPRDRVYTAREDESGKTVATFGNGTEGARLPTGTENVAAQYRVGSGLAGRVRQGQLSMLLTRPLGVSAAVNPLPATGGSDPESPEDIGSNIPRSALTLGRVVSLMDFADAATRLPNVAKAQGALIWKGDARVVFLTVSGPDGAATDVDAVSASLDGQRDPHQTVVVMNAERLLFRTEIEILVREDYLADDVLAGVKAALVETFGFDERDFAEAVTVSEIDAAVHRVPGVRAANVTVLDFSDANPPGKNDVLRIEPARFDGALAPAQILLIDPTGIALKEALGDL